jgi:hypothetical protein|tara:strand:- start:954 stop:1103 length:150 start_codon:yes stop_codon:yes gene_type:complete
MQNTITIQIDEDNDIFELTVDNKTYDLYNVYDSKYGDFFDELNILIDEL